LTQEIKKDFWGNQYSEEITPKQKWFDVIFGIIAPTLCLIFDPIVFRRVYGSYLNNIQIFAYISIGFGIITLTIWLSMKRIPVPLVGIISGMFFAGAFLALALGIAMLPLSLLGLLLIVGIFGFTPFLTAFVFLRNAVRSFRKVQSRMNKGLLVGTMLFGIAFVIGIPITINMKTSELVSQSVYTIIHSDKEGEINTAIDKLNSAFWCSKSCYDEIIWAYNQEESDTRRQLLSKAYLELTGENIENTLWVGND
jgi:hypothetical protein